MFSPACSAHLDQAMAARREALDVLDRAAQTVGSPIHTNPPSPWLRRHARALAVSLADGTARPCPHLGAPQLVHAAVWAPGRLACTACAPTYLAPTETEDTTCDHCRTPDLILHTGLAAIGPVLLAFGLCEPCLRATAVTPASITVRNRQSER